MDSNYRVTLNCNCDRLQESENSDDFDDLHLAKRNTKVESVKQQCTTNEPDAIQRMDPKLKREKAKKPKKPKAQCSLRSKSRDECVQSMCRSVSNRAKSN